MWEELSIIDQSWQQLCKKQGPAYQNILKSGKLKIGDMTMIFSYQVIGDKPIGGYGLIFGLHGGGGCPAQTNDKQYENHKNLYKGHIPQGFIWFTPRSAQDAWNMWFKPYMQDFLNYFINAFTLLEMVNSNKVFLTGYSAGGDAIYHLAPRMADIFAGAAMMAGHPNNADLTNIRNLSFAIQVGEKDEAYNRNKQANIYIDKLNKLSDKYGGYKHYSKVREGKSHWMGLEQTQIFPSLFSTIRNPYPQFIVFKKNSEIKNNLLYYVRVQKWQKDDIVTVRKNQNTFIIESDCSVTIFLNRKMVNPMKHIIVFHNKLKTYQTMLATFPSIVQKTMMERKDPDYIFQDALISVPEMICNSFRQLEAQNICSKQ